MQLVLSVCSCTEEVQSPVGLYPLPGPDGLATEEAIRLLRAPTENVVVLPHIPRGTKNYVYCLIDISRSLKLRNFGYNRIFDDDSGPWQSSKSSCVISPYIVDSQNGLKRIFWIASQQAYCSETKVEGRRVYIPLDPQPLPDTVIKIKRYYVKLAANDAYRRRITMLNKSSVAPEHNVAIVEYFGERAVGPVQSQNDDDNENHDDDCHTLVAEEKVEDSQSLENATEERNCESLAELQSYTPLLLDDGLMSHTELPLKEIPRCLLDTDHHSSEVKYFLLSTCESLMLLVNI